jgi:hypothetical protein
MASDNAVLPDGYELLCTAPDHVVDTILALMPPADPGNVGQARSRRAEAAAHANRIWAEAAHAGAAWGIARAPHRMEIDVSASPLLGDLIRKIGE